MKREKILLRILLTIMIVLTIVRSYLMTDLYFLSLTYADIQARIQEEKHKNLLLKEALLQQHSLLYIEQEARRKGFVQATYVFIR